MKMSLAKNLKSFRNHWYVWLFPVIAFFISGYLFQQHFYNHGPTIQIAFDEATTIQNEKTRVRFRGVDIGIVKKITLSLDRKDVIVHVRLEKGADDFAVAGSSFWIVTPKVSLQGMSGLDTIFSGPYIEALPGPAGGALQTHFKGRSQPAEDADTLENTSTYTVNTTSAESLNTGDSITYRGLNVGTIGKMSLNKSGQTIEIQLLILNRYTRLIRTNTVFWNKVGIQAKLGLFGSKIKVNSVDSIMRGGIELATPDTAGPQAKANTQFTLALEAPKDAEKWSPILD